MKIYATLVLTLALLLLTACQGTMTGSTVSVPTVVIEESTDSGTSFTVPETHYVVLENGRFMPTDLEINVNDVVEWINKDDERHAVTFTDGSFDQVLPEGAVLRMSFSETGEYWYVNQLEAGMRGRIIVR